MERWVQTVVFDHSFWRCTAMPAAPAGPSHLPS
jgi:hypothetical protein